MSTATRACGYGAMTSSDKPFSEEFEVKIEFRAVDPELLDILTGGIFETAPVFAVEVHAPIKRTFWQWLLRKPRRYQNTYIPRARIEGA